MHVLEAVFYAHPYRGCAWYMERDGTGRDEAFCPVFGTPKNCGTGCPMRRNLTDFSFHLSPWNDPFHIRGTQIYNILRQIFPYFFFNIYIVCSVMSRSVSSRLRTKRYLSASASATKLYTHGYLPTPRATFKIQAKSLASCNPSKTSHPLYSKSHTTTLRKRHRWHYNTQVHACTKGQVKFVYDGCIRSYFK